ncbi:XkdX family protein [Bacillus infantis]|nr:XkdX family protein [Bacillus infantis]
MNWYELIKRYYPKYWTISMVGDGVKAEKITEDQYKEITGQDYKA